LIQIALTNLIGRYFLVLDLFFYIFRLVGHSGSARIGCNGAVVRLRFVINDFGDEAVSFVGIAVLFS